MNLVWRILTARKSFADPVIGNRMANRLGLHVVRVLLADAMLGLRRLLVSGLSRSQMQRQFARDGMLAITDFLPADEFQRLQQEARDLMEQVDQGSPVPDYNEAGFGVVHAYDWGFDRCDGSSVNRFYNLSADACQAFLDNPELKKLVEYAAGCRFRRDRFQLYRLLQGESGAKEDNQRQIHRDTFHSAIKIWYSLSDVTLAHGPLHFLPGSQRMTAKRLLWEYRKSNWAAANNRGGAFRATAAEITQQYGGMPKPLEVPANTLVIADIRGWHHRGFAEVGSERLAIYASFRPSPYGLPRVGPLPVTHSAHN